MKIRVQTAVKYIGTPKIPTPKINVAETCRNKASATKFKGTRNILAAQSKVKIISRKQNSSAQVHIKISMNLWYTAVLF